MCLKYYLLGLVFNHSLTQSYLLVILISLIWLSCLLVILIMNSDNKQNWTT